MEKKYFEKTISENFRYLIFFQKTRKCPLEILKIVIDILKICNENFHWHFENFQIFRNIFFKLNFLNDEKYFSMRFFFKVH